MSEDQFAIFWETTLPAGVPEEVVAKWRAYELSAVQRGRTIIDQFRGYVSVRGLCAVDLGCGYGGLSVALAQEGARVTGVDYDEQRLDGARIRVQQDDTDTQIRLCRAAGEGLPYRNAAFDLIMCNDVLEHVSSHKQILREVGRVLKTHGWVCLTFPNRLSPTNAKSDPHYGLFGVSVLSPRLGSWYVIRLRRRSDRYEVGQFPIASQIVRALRSSGIEVVRWWPAPQRKLGPFTWLLVAYRLNTQPLITLLCRKEA